LMHNILLLWKRWRNTMFVITCTMWRLMSSNKVWITCWWNLVFIMNHNVTTIVMRFVNLLVLKALVDVQVVVLYMLGLLYFGNQLFAPMMSFQNGMFENAYSVRVKARYGVQRLLSQILFLEIVCFWTPTKLILIYFIYKLYLK
jgi:hypothetical protein